MVIKLHSFSGHVWLCSMHCHQPLFFSSPGHVLLCSLCVILKNANALPVTLLDPRQKPWKVVCDNMLFEKQNMGTVTACPFLGMLWKIL